MNRKRKLPKVDEEKENNLECCAMTQSPVTQGPMYTILSSAQLNEALHKRYIKELKQLYSKMDHDAFVYTFIKMLKTVLEAEETNEYGNMALLFCAKFVTSFECEGTHPVLSSIFKWLLSTVSNSPHIRYRLCYFVNLILKEFGLQAALDDAHCDRILEYMLERLRDVSANVRKQAVLAMQRLQVPDNPDDPVLRAYQYHLCSDPSSNVRQCVITCMGRNYHTIPYILDRLWDIDEKVRRHTYMNMCSYPVRSYKVSQRLTLLEQGLNDTSEGVRKSVIKYMLKQWLESYNLNPITLTAALKLDSNEEEMERFRKVAKQMLRVIFEQGANQELMAHLPLAEDCELHRCVPQDKLNVEVVLYWQCLYEYFLDTQADECDLIVPELSTFCSYVEKFSQLQTPDMDKFVRIEFQYMMLSLIEILQSYDLGDEIGRVNLRKLLTMLLKDCLLDHKIIKWIVLCAESLITDASERFQYFQDIIYEICELNTKQCDLVHDRNLLGKLLDNMDADMKTKVSSLKVKILELEEQEEIYVGQKEYIRAQAMNDERNVATEEYMALLKPLLDKDIFVDLPDRPKLTKQESILKSLYITFYMVVSEKVQTLNPSSCKLFHDFICRHMASNENDIREWAIKCGTAYSMLYEAFAKEVFDLLYIQFYKSINLRVWDTAVNCVFELLNRYGVENFGDGDQASKTRRPGRQLYNTLEYLDAPEDSNVSNAADQGVGVIYMMSHFLDTCEDVCITRSIIKGFCRLVLLGHLKDRNDILEKLLRVYFNPNTDTSISQILGVFFEHVVEMKLQSQLQPCFLPMLANVFIANFDSPLAEVSPETVTKFFIDLTHQDDSTPEENIHNKIALSFLQEIHNNAKERKDMCRVLAKEITTLKLNLENMSNLKEEMKTLADKLIKAELDPKSIKNIINFKGMLDGVFNPPLRKTEGNESDEEDDSETVTTASEYANTAVTESDDVAKGDAQPNETEEIMETGSNSQELIAAPVNEIPVSTATTENADDTIETTFGQDNHFGIRSLRRSLHKSLSQSDNESTNERNNKTTELGSRKRLDAQKKELKDVQAITRRRLRRYSAKDDEVEAISEEIVDKTQCSRSLVQKTRPEARKEQDQQSVSNEELNDSDVIPESPIAATANATNSSRLRLRSVRIRSLAQKDITAKKQQQQNQPATASKQNNAHEEELNTKTPQRNGRKRVLRKSPKPKKPSQASTSPPTISPLRKQQRVAADMHSPERPLAKAQERRKATGEAAATSPTGSSSSSKENNKPAQVQVPSVVLPSAVVTSARKSTSTTTTAANNRQTKSSAESDSNNNSNDGSISTRLRQSTTITTRNSARKERMSSMCMTRKRMSVELNTSSSSSSNQQKFPTPKRFQTEKKAKAPSSRRSSGHSIAKTSSNSSIETCSPASSSTEAAHPTKKKQPKVLTTPRIQLSRTRRK